MSIIPLVCAVFLNFGLMGWFGIELTHLTALLSSIIIGVGVDFTIHYISEYQKIKREQGLDNISKDTKLDIPVELVEMDEIFKKCDIITVHTPLTPSTKDLISKGSISLMKDGVMIINCARGGIVNEQDVLEGIEQGKIGGAAFDVFESEPPDFKSPIFNQSDKVIFTPHLGASTQEAQTKVGIAMA